MPHPVAALPLHPQRRLLLPNVLFSSRRRYRKQSAQYQGRLPDWVWGAGLGAIVLLFVAGFFLFSRCTANASTCDNPLKPIGVAPPTTAESFQQEDQDLNRLITALQQGDTNSANALFFGPAHNFMHTAEPEIRAKDEQLGKKLCEAVIKFETDFDPAPGAAPATPQQLANEVVVIRDHLRDGAAVLGYPRSGT